MKNKTLMSIIVAGACMTSATMAEAKSHHHHRGDRTAARIGATFHGIADVVDALNGRPRVIAPVVAPAVVAPAPAVVAPAPAVVAPAVVTPAVTPAVVTPAVVTPAVVTPAVAPVRPIVYPGQTIFR